MLLCYLKVGAAILTSAASTDADDASVIAPSVTWR